MAVKIGHAAINENGTINGGKPGDQTGKEVCIRDWWAMGWTALIRPKTQELAEMLSANCEAACLNECVGYDQTDRLSLYNAAREVGFVLADIKKPCNTDCSALQALLSIASGVYVHPDITTRNMVQVFEATGKYEILRGPEYLASSQYLKRGDILVKEGAHTVMVLTNGSKITDREPVPEPEENIMYAESFEKKLAGNYRVKTALNLRRGAGKTYKIIAVLPKDAIVQNYGYYTLCEGVKWLYVKYNDHVGFCSGTYLDKE